MTSDVPIRRAGAVIASLPQGRISAGGQQIQAAGREVVQFSQQVNQRIQENAFLDAQITMSRELSRIEREHANDPATLQGALNGFRKEFLSNAPSRIRDRLELQYETSTAPMVMRSIKTHQKRVDEEARTQQFLAADELMRQLNSYSTDIVSGDQDRIEAAITGAQGAMFQFQDLVNQTGSDGAALSTPQQRAAMLTKGRDDFFQSIAYAYVKQSQDPLQAVKTLQTEGYELTFPDVDGEVTALNVRDFLDKSAFSGLNEEAKKQIKQKNSVDLHTQIQNEAVLREQIFDDTLPSDEKRANIDKMAVMGQISDQFAKEARRYVTSSAKINAVTNDAVISDILIRTHDLNAIADLSPDEYLDGIRNIQNEIVARRASGDLSSDDEKKLNNQIKTLTSAKQADATNMVALSFGEARKMIEEQLPPDMRGTAIRKLFYATEQDRIKAEDDNDFRAQLKNAYKDQARQIIDEINGDRRTAAVEAIREVIAANVETQDTFDSAEDVKQAMQAGQLTKDQALNILRTSFGFE